MLIAAVRDCLAPRVVRLDAVVFGSQPVAAALAAHAGELVSGPGVRAATVLGQRLAVVSKVFALIVSCFDDGLSAKAVLRAVQGSPGSVLGTAAVLVPRAPVAHEGDALG